MSLLAAGLAGAAACDSTKADSEFVDPDSGLATETSTALPEAAPPVVRDDFRAPVFAEGATAAAEAVFAKPDGTAGALDGGATGPCLYEPEMGSLFPSNWLRPRFRWNVASAEENLFQIKLVVPNQTSPLVVYTTKSGYILDKSLWNTLTATGTGTVHVTVRSAVVDASGTTTAGPFLGTEGDIEIAPPSVTASGSVVYWTTSGGTVLKGFKVGDETVQSVITPAQAGSQCVACHTSTPDGVYAGVTGSSSPTDGTPGSIALRTVDGASTEPPFLTAPARALMARQQWAPTFSKGHWAAGDHTMISMMNVAGRTEMVWTDLEAPSEAAGSGVLARTAENTAASSAVWSHDGSKVAYVATTTGAGAGVIANDGQVHIVPYANRAGGAPVPLAGAADPTFNQFYPNFAADDQLLAFNRVPNGESSYNNAKAELFIVPAAGGTPTRLAANDPPACLAAKKSPGITNSWAKFSPEVRIDGSKKYYFVVFSSTRNPASNGGPQLYVAPVVVDGATVKTYAALGLWNQPENENNHTPAWDVFQLPGPK